MSSKLVVADGAFKPLTGVELRSLSREDKNSQDEHDMAVLGRAQELNVSKQNPSLDRGTKLNLQQRNFRFISTLGFACTLMSTWEISLMSVPYPDA